VETSASFGDEADHEAVRRMAAVLAEARGGSAADDGRRRMNAVVAARLLGTTVPVGLPADLQHRLSAVGVAGGNEYLVALAAESTLATDVRTDSSGCLRVVADDRRRRRGSYFTPPAVARYLVEAAMDGTDASTVRVAYPACGTGMFLLAVADWLAANRHRKVVAVGQDIAGPAVEMAAVLVRSRARWLGVADRMELALHTADALLDETWSRDYDAVIGNPPFLSEVRKQAHRFSSYRSAPLVGRYYRHKMDILYFFMALAIEVLRPGGRAALVVADYWTDRAAAKPLRDELCAATRLLEYVALGGDRPFRGAPGFHGALMVFEKTKPPSDTTFRLVRRAGGVGPPREGRGLLVRRDDVVQLVFRDEHEVLQTLFARGTLRLDRQGCAQGIVGPQTRIGVARRGRHDPADGQGVFVLTDAELESLRLGPRERAFCRPYFRATQFEPYRIAGPPAGTLLYMDGAARRAVVERPRDFPHLRRHFESLSEAITSSFGPYGLHRPRRRRLFEGPPRLVGVRKTFYPRFTLATSPVYVGETCCVVTDDCGVPLDYALVLLNSTVAHFVLLHMKSQGSLLQIDKEPLCNVPLAAGTPAVRARVGAVGRTGPPPEGRSGWLRAMDRVVYALYGLDAPAVALVEASTAHGGRGGEGGPLPSLDEALSYVGLSLLAPALLSSHTGAKRGPRMRKGDVMQPLVGLSMWDIGGWDHSSKRTPLRPDFYEQVLARQIEAYYGLLTAAELAQEADYQNKDVRTWSRMDLLDVPGVLLFLLNCRRLAIHLRHGNVDIADHENPTHRRWSLTEVKLGIEFAFRSGADTCILHPGTYNERAGRFWPRADEVGDFIRLRSRALEESLAEVAGVFVAGAVQREERLGEFERREPGLADELTALLKELRGMPRGEKRIRLLARGLDLIDRGRLTPEQVRHCHEPWSGLHLCVENLEPPNFLVCTPSQMRTIFDRLTEFYREAAAHAGLSAAAVERYRPMLAIDPGHMLNSKVILTQPNNRAYLDALDGGDDLHRNFVQLPGQYPSHEVRSELVEPLLNQFVRRHGDDICWVHLYGCTRTDTCMTTHGPIKAFRSSVMLERGPDGEPIHRYGTSNYQPTEELNLEEVVQVVGTELPYITEVFGAPVEVVKSSAVNTFHFIEYLRDERRRAIEAIRRAVGVEAERPETTDAERERLRWLASALVSARTYVRPRASSAGFWTVGYDEIGFYRYVDDPEAANVDIFATLKQDGSKVWLKGIHPA